MGLLVELTSPASSHISNYNIVLNGNKSEIPKLVAYDILSAIA